MERGIFGVVMGLVLSGVTLTMAGCDELSAIETPPGEETAAGEGLELNVDVRSVTPVERMDVSILRTSCGGEKFAPYQKIIVSTTLHRSANDMQNFRTVVTGLPNGCYVVNFAPIERRSLREFKCFEPMGRNVQVEAGQLTRVAFTNNCEAPAVEVAPPAKK